MSFFCFLDGVGDDDGDGVGLEMGGIWTCGFFGVDVADGTTTAERGNGTGVGEDNGPVTLFGIESHPMNTLRIAAIVPITTIQNVGTNVQWGFRSAERCSESSLCCLIVSSS